MKLLHRALISIFRNIKNSMILLMVFSVIGVFITGIAFTGYGLASIKDQIIAATRPIVYPQYQLEDNINDSGLWAKENRNKRETLSFYKGILDGFFTDNRVKSYSYELYKYCYSDVLYKDVLDWKKAVSETDYYNQLCVHGVYQPSFHDIVANNIVIIEGTSFSNQQIDSGAHVCAISDNLYIDSNGEKTHINIGDYIPISIVLFDTDNGYFVNSKERVLEQQTIMFKVIGKYHINTNNTSSGILSDIMIYIPNIAVEDLDKINDLQETRHVIQKEVMYEPYNTNCMGITNVRIELKSIEDIIQFTLDMSDELWSLNHGPNNLNIEGLPIKDYFRIVKSTDVFSHLDWFVSGFESLSEVLVIVMLIISTVLIVMTIRLQTKKRQNEFGILLSIGERKKLLVVQLVLEIILLSTPAYVSSTYIGYYLSKPITQQLISRNLINDSADSESTVEAEEYYSFKEYTTDGLQIEGMGSKSFKSILLTELSVTTIAALVQTFFIIQLKPKKILLEE
ncbi:MAG: ABC transporter permease [Erysipelotrichaceae bacterium]|nr:ABC transporter permease [Erysipelotrichaceae bacterium]